MQAELVKWGNSQGVRIPREVCNALGVDIGAKGEMDFDLINSELVIRFNKPSRKYQRSRKITMQELLAGWEGEKVGEEWGGPDVGAEVIE